MCPVAGRSLPLAPQAEASFMVPVEHSWRGGESLLMGMLRLLLLCPTIKLFLNHYTISQPYLSDEQ